MMDSTGAIVNPRESVLLVSLGTSPAIVPEAFLLPDARFRTVHVITTEETKVDFIQQWFAEHAPGTALSVTRVHGFKDFTNEGDHFRFEEVLYRWILETNTRPGERVLCLSGGFKTMSAAMQKAAAVLGAKEVFHVLCDLPSASQPKTAPEIEAARTGGHLHWIRLGPESGWPQLRATAAAEYPLDTVSVAGCVRWARSPDSAFRERLRTIVERSHRIAGAWDRLPELPFADLATWSEADLAWLNSPVEPQAAADRDWIAALPKLELHCHLGGFATHGVELDDVRAAAEKPADLPALERRAPPPHWPLVTLPEKQPDRLRAYMTLGDNNGSRLLRDAGCLKRQCELLYDHLVRDKVIYAEVRCSPANYASATRSAWTVLDDIRSAFNGRMDGARKTGAPVCHVNLLLIATRRETGDFRATIYRHLALAMSAAEHWTCDEECRVVGVDLAGYEDITTRAHYFREEFTGVHRAGLALTVHAGENDDAEGIWSAVFDLNARRLGHALHLIDSPELMRSVADRGIGVEMCPYANLQIKGYPLDDAVKEAANRDRYPLQKYLQAGIQVTVNTDNIGISAAGLTHNLLLAARLCPGLTRLDILRLQRHALEAAFLSPAGRAAVAREVAAGIPKL